MRMEGGSIDSSTRCVAFLLGDFRQNQTGLARFSPTLNHQFERELQRRLLFKSTPCKHAFRSSEERPSYFPLETQCQCLRASGEENRHYRCRLISRRERTCARSRKSSTDRVESNQLMLVCVFRKMTSLSKSRSLMRASKPTNSTLPHTP